jgi:hypothetical protein
MLQLAFDIAQWVVWVAGAIAVAALLMLGWGLARPPRRLSVPSVAALVVAGAVCIASVQFLGTRVQHVTLGSITQLGLEKDHAGLRTNALVYSVPVSVTASWKPLPSFVPGNGVVGDLAHKTVTVTAQVAVYGLIDFTKITHQTATVDRQARTITVSLPDPVVSKGTTYIWAVDGVQEHTGVLNAIEQSLVGPFEALFGHSQVSFNIEPELTYAEAAALPLAQHSTALASCGKQEIVQQLTAEFNLLPAYQGYTVHVNWPHPPVPGVSCSGLQRQLGSARGLGGAGG